MRAALQRQPRPARSASDQPLHRRWAPARTSALPSADRARMLEAAKLSDNLYEVLGLSPRASVLEVKSAFRRLAKSSHPDFNSDDATAQHRFQLVHLAYRVLCDIEMRADYDRHLLSIGFSDTAHTQPVPRWRRIGGAVMVPVLVVILTPIFVLGFERGAFNQVVAMVAQWRGAPASPPTDHRREAIKHAAPDVATVPLTQASTDANAAPTEEPMAAPAVSMPAPAAPALAASAAPVPAVIATAPVPAAATTAPMPAVTTTATPGVTNDDSGTLDQARRLLQQGERYAAEGNIATARQYFVRAADLGLAMAATRMAETFEAALLERNRVHGLKPDPVEAATWRQRAFELDARQSERAAQRSSP